MLKLEQTIVIKQQNVSEREIPSETSIYLYRNEETKDIELVIKKYNTNGIIDRSVLFELLKSLIKRANKTTGSDVIVKVFDRSCDALLNVVGYAFDGVEEKDGQTVRNYIYEAR